MPRGRPVPSPAARTRERARSSRRRGRRDRRRDQSGLRGALPSPIPLSSLRAKHQRAHAEQRTKSRAAGRVSRASRVSVLGSARAGPERRLSEGTAEPAGNKSQWGTGREPRGSQDPRDRAEPPVPAGSRAAQEAQAPAAPIPGAVSLRLPGRARSFWSGVPRPGQLSLQHRLRRRTHCQPRSWLRPPTPRTGSAPVNSPRCMATPPSRRPTNPWSIPDPQPRRASLQVRRQITVAFTQNGQGPDGSHHTHTGPWPQAPTGAAASKWSCVHSAPYR